MGYFFCCTYHVFYFVELEFDLAEVNLTRHQNDSDVDICLASAGISREAVGVIKAGKVEAAIMTHQRIQSRLH